MYCKKCGNELEETSFFCSRCGERVLSGSGISQPNDLSTNTTQRTSSESFRNKNAWEYFISAFKKYVSFDGRARRAEYWYFSLFCSVFYILASFLDKIFLNRSFEDFGVFYIITSLVLFFPSLSVMVRRYHDLDKRAWYFLIPIYGFILLFYDGTHGPNRFGEDPKGR